jgi:hypothetical protein
MSYVKIGEMDIGVSQQITVDGQRLWWRFTNEQWCKVGAWIADYLEKTAPRTDKETKKLEVSIRERK